LVISSSIEYGGLTYGVGITAKVRSDALTGTDPWDVEAPPAPPEGLEMLFLMRGVGYLEDVRPPTLTITYHFTVRTIGVEGYVTLAWNSSSVPLKYTVFIIDRYAGVMIDMRARNNYTFNLGLNAVREFEVVVCRGV